MTAFTKLLAGCGALLAIGIAAPAAAQYYPSYGAYPGAGYGAYPQPGYAAPYGGGYAGGYGPDRQVAINQCASAAQARLGGYGGGRVLGISQVSPREDGGLTVRGVASSGRYANAYAYGGEPRVDMTWRCRTDFRGYIRDVSFNGGNTVYGGGYPYGYGNNNASSSWDNDYSQFGYRRY